MKVVSISFVKSDTLTIEYKLIEYKDVWLHVTDTNNIKRSYPVVRITEVIEWPEGADFD